MIVIFYCEFGIICDIANQTAVLIVNILQCYAQLCFLFIKY